MSCLSNLIGEDARLIAQSDPQVEFAARIKANISEWQQHSVTGTVERQLAQVNTMPRMYSRMMFSTTAMPTAMPMMAIPPSPMVGCAFMATAMRTQNGTLGMVMPVQAAPTPSATTYAGAPVLPRGGVQQYCEGTGEASVEVKLGDSMTRYSIEAFALSPETLDWQRVETTLEATQEVYGELTVSPFVFPGDPVMGRLDVGVASGNALVEVQHNGETLPIFSVTGNQLTPNAPVPSGSTVYFPVHPGTITSIVRDASSGASDVSESYITEPGKLRSHRAYTALTHAW